MDNPQAFPIQGFKEKGSMVGYTRPQEGMTLRDYFAAFVVCKYSKFMLRVRFELVLVTFMTEYKLVGVSEQDANFVVACILFCTDTNNRLYINTLE